MENIDKNLGEDQILGQTPERDIEENMLIEAMQNSLMGFSKLPSKLQEDIIEDIKNKKTEKVNFTDISNRLSLLVDKGNELLNMSVDESDRFYRPKPTPEDLKLAEENGDVDKTIEKQIDDLLEELEKIKNDKARKEKEPKSIDVSKLPPLPKDEIQ